MYQVLQAAALGTLKQYDSNHLHKSAAPKQKPPVPDMKEAANKASLAKVWNPLATRLEHCMIALAVELTTWTATGIAGTERSPEMMAN